MNPEIEKMLLALAQKFNTTVEHLWAVLIAQAKIEAGYNVAVILAGLLFYVVAFLSLKRWHNYIVDEDGCYDDAAFTEWFVSTGITLIVGIFVFFDMFDAGYNIATQLLNPEFWALKQVMKGLQ